MVIDSISPTFSIPSASTFFEISTDNGITYTDANVIEVNYYALNKMNGFIGDANPLNLLFRKKDNIEDASNFKITKILVNEASTFLPSPNTGLNVESTSTQAATALYLAGRYATYNGVTTGGLNFSDFKIQSINDTAMQMVFFVVGKMKLKVETPTVTVYSDDKKTYYLKMSVHAETTAEIDENTNTIQIKTNVNQGVFETNYPDLTLSKITNFTYQMTYVNCFSTEETFWTNAFTGDRNWTVAISDIVWQDNPLIRFEFTFIRYKDEDTTEDIFWYGNP